MLCTVVRAVPMLLAHIVPQDEHIPTITPEFISRLVAQAHEGLKKE